MLGPSESLEVAAAMALHFSFLILALLAGYGVLLKESACITSPNLTNGVNLSAEASLALSALQKALALNC